MGMLAWDVLMFVFVVTFYSWAAYRIIRQSKIRIEQHIRIGNGNIDECEAGYRVRMPVEIPEGSIFSDGLNKMNFVPSRLGVRVMTESTRYDPIESALTATFARRLDAEEAQAILRRRYFWAHLIEQRRQETRKTG